MTGGLNEPGLHPVLLEAPNNERSPPKRALELVRKKGLEPSRPCGRQPLTLGELVC